MTVLLLFYLSLGKASALAVHCDVSLVGRCPQFMWDVKGHFIPLSLFYYVRFETCLKSIVFHETWIKHIK